MFTPRTHVVVCHACGRFHEFTTEFLSAGMSVAMPTENGRTWVLPNLACPDCRKHAESLPIVNGFRPDSPIYKAFREGMSADARARMLAEWPEWQTRVAAVNASR